MSPKCPGGVLKPRVGGFIHPVTNPILTKLRDDLIFYTITSDTTLRIFLPVVDAPEYLQLHAAIDLFSSLPYSVVSQVSSPASSVFWLDRTTVERVIIKLLADKHQVDDARNRRIREIKEEGWDLFLRILTDGSVVVTAVAVCIFPHSCLIHPHQRFRI